MAAPLTAFRLVLTFAVGLAAATLATFASPAPSPAAGLSLGEMLMGQKAGEGRKPAAPVIARYEMDEGGAFVLDRSTPKPLLKFDDSPEIWQLQPAPGPRGDVIYRNDLGEPMLRATLLGGMTVFTEKRPDGSAAALVGASPPLRIAPLSPAGLFNRFYQSSVRASRAAQHEVEFDTGQDAEPATAASLADAAMVTSEALVGLATRPGGKAFLARISAVVIAQGERPAVNLQKGVLTITIVTAEGIGGRPSSRRIERVTWSH
jgi:hypothetical protein